MAFNTLERSTAAVAIPGGCAISLVRKKSAVLESSLKGE
jgi:hypothetical protein